MFVFGENVFIVTSIYPSRGHNSNKYAMGGGGAHCKINGKMYQNHCSTALAYNLFIHFMN